MTHAWTEFELVSRIVAAAFLSAALGWEREAAGKAAGLRTHMIVGTTAALFVIVGLLAVVRYPGPLGSISADPTRAIYAIAVGVGFLGTGVVFRAEDKVRGLTTAASLWGTAAVGTATGYGLYVLALATTLILFLILRTIRRFERGNGAD